MTKDNTLLAVDITESKEFKQGRHIGQLEGQLSQALADIKLLREALDTLLNDYNADTEAIGIEALESTRKYD